jgi:chromosomal replication initiation ATPase DnaA
VDEDTIAYLVPRIERSLAGVRATVARLDSASLALGRRVTRPLATEILRQNPP